MVTGVQSNGQSALAPCCGLMDQLRRGHAETVVGDGERMGGTKPRGQQPLYLFANDRRERRLRLAVDAKDLLADGVSPARKESRFSRGGPFFHADDAGDIDFFASKVGDETVTGGVVPNRGNGKHACTECGQVIRGVSATARNQMSFAVAKD